MPRLICCDSQYVIFAHLPGVDKLLDVKLDVAIRVTCLPTGNKREMHLGPNRFVYIVSCCQSHVLM